MIIASKVLTTEIYNVFGQQIYSKQVNIDNANSIEIDGFEEGVYVIKLIIDGIQNKTTRIIITK